MHNGRHYVLCVLCMQTDSRNSIHLLQTQEPVFNSKVPDIGKSLCLLLKMVFDAYPVDPAPPPDVKPSHSNNTTEVKLSQQTVTPEIRQLHAKVEELILKNLGAVVATQPAVESRAASSIISFTLSIVETLTENNKSYIDRYMMPLIRVIQRLAREMVTISGAVARQVFLYDLDSIVRCIALFLLFFLVFLS